MTDFIDLEREIGSEDEQQETESAAARSTAVVVAGMHRSGTSAVVRVLALLGLDLPQTLYPTRPDNPLGYWEPLAVVEAHEEFLAAVGSSFDDFFALGEGALRGSAAKALEDKLVTVLEQEYGTSTQFVVKDPRICRLIPVWIAALKRFGATPRFVLPVRNPLEVAASLKLRNEYGTTKSLLLWLRHVLEAEQRTRGLRRSVVSYERLLRDWQGAIGKISHELGLVWPRSSHTAHAEIEQFLSPRRRHHAFAADELDARPDVVDWVKTTYEVLSATAAGEQLEQDVLDAVRAELDRAERAFGPLLADLSLSQRKQEVALSEQAAKLEEATAAAESRARDLDERTQALGDATAERERLAAELAERQEALSAATAEAANFREQVERLGAELAERERSADNARDSVSRLTTELESLQEAVTARTAEAAAARENVERLQGELAERERTLADAQADVGRLTTDLTELRESLAAVTAEAGSLREQIEQFQAALAHREQALNEARFEVSNLTRELAERREAVTTAAAEAAMSREQVERLRAELTERETLLAAARADVTQLTEDLARREEARAQAELTARELEQRVQSLVDEAAAQEARARRAVREADDVRIDLASRGERLAKVQTALDEARKRGAQLSDQLQRQAEALSAADAEKDRLRAEDEVLRAALVERESRLSRLEAEKTELEAAASDLQQALASRAEEARRSAALAADLRAKVAELEASEACSRSELGEAKAALDLARGDIERLSSEVAERDAKLTKLATRRFTRPRTRWRAISQLASWLVRPPRGWRLLRQYRQLRRAGTFPVEAYLAENPDVDASGLDPLMHYVEHGVREGRVLGPSPAEPVVASAVLVPAPPPIAQTSQSPAVVSKPSIVVKPRAIRTTPPPDPQPAADYSDFIVLLSRQRSGTNPLRSILGTHPDVFCFNEVFNLPDKDSDEPLLRESNFFTFLERYGKEDIRRTMPDYHERLFLDYLEYLRCLSEKRYALIDVKYNTTHLLTPPWQQRTPSYLLELIAKHGLYVLNVTRRNYLRYVLSTEKAWYSNRYTVIQADAAYVDEKLRLDPEYALSELTRCSEEDDRIQQGLSTTDRVLAYDYAEIFPGHGIVISPDFLEQFANWRGIAGNQFVVDPEYRKQSTLPLQETIENYDALAAALRDSPFAYCLEDESAYRPAGSPSSSPSQGSIVRTSYSDSEREHWLGAIGSDPDSFVEALCRTRPHWIEGSLSQDDARFLFQQALRTDSEEGIEVGTASGFSTTLLAYAFDFRSAAGRAPGDWRVLSYDILEHLYFDQDRRVGDAAREILPESLLAHVQFNSPATAVDVGVGHASDSICFLFIDANHKHPWPALDLLALLNGLRAGATVLLHDINLPLIHPEFPAWGVNRVFAGLELEKIVPDVELPNIGGFLVPDDKEHLRDQLLAILSNHPWEVEVPDDLLERVIPGRAGRAGR